MSYSREDQKAIDAKRAELDALERAREGIEFRLDDNSTNPAWSAATDEVIRAREDLARAERDAEQEMREKAKYARENPDSREATVFSDTYHTDPARVEAPKDDGCVVM